jgi:hypothetical protein
MGGGPFYVQPGGSRICNTTRVDQSGADDANVTDWTKTDVIIVAVNINSGGKDTEAAQYKLRWRDETDNPGGAFSDLDTTGECKFGDATALNHGTNILVGTRRCDSQGNDTWQNGEEVEGTKLSDSIDLPDEYETELHIAVSLADGNDGHQYTFDLYDSTRGAQVGVLGAQITLATGSQTFYQNTGQGTTSPTGSIIKKTSKDIGAHVMTIAGDVATATIFLQSIGAGIVSPTGILGKTTTYVRNMGQATMAITGDLSKQTSIFIGKASLSISGICRGRNT